MAINEIKKITKLIKNLHSDSELECFFKELLTKSEIETLSKRWRILELLHAGESQRNIAKTLQVSLCKVTRGSKILKDKNSILAKTLLKEITNEFEQ